MTVPGDTSGILNPREGLAHFQLARPEPAADLVDFIDWHWSWSR